VLSEHLKHSDSTKYVRIFANRSTKLQKSAILNYRHPGEPTSRRSVAMSRLAKAETGVQNILKILDSRLRGNDKMGLIF
jgi:hypothetical protein